MLRQGGERTSKYLDKQHKYKDDLKYKNDPQYEDNHNYEDNKNLEDDHKQKDYLKYEDNLKYLYKTTKPSQTYWTEENVTNQAFLSHNIKRPKSNS